MILHEELRESTGLHLQIIEAMRSQLICAKVQYCDVRYSEYEYFLANANDEFTEIFQAKAKALYKKMWATQESVVDHWLDSLIEEWNEE